MVLAALVPSIAEEARQEITGDQKFFRRIPYYFELEVPAEVGLSHGGTRYAYPLVLNPEAVSVSEPFSVQATPTQGAGLFVEENGIIQRMIRISGHTGFKPRPFKADQVLGNLVTKDKRSYSRDIVHLVPAALSGHRHFQYLQDAVFRTYADLKRDPTTAKDTKLYFHNPKDDEHWQVIPQSFQLSRDKSQPLLYRYEIDLLAVEKAEDADRDFSEEKGLLDAIKDGIRMVQAGIDMVKSAINTITAVVEEIKSFVRAIGSIIQSAIGVIDAASNFIAGTSDLIQVPFKVLEDVGTALAGAIETLVDQSVALGATVTSVPDSVVNALRRIGDGFAAIGTHPELFETPAEKALREAARRAELSVGVSTAALAAAEAATGPTNFAQMRTQGTALEKGDRLRAQSELGVGRAQPQFSGAQQRIVEQGDSLPTLAAKYLGDARLWRQIAILNNLRSPYISEHGAPHTLGIGDPILIPTATPPAQRGALVATLGSRPDEPTEDQLLGVDFALEPASGARGFYDIPINFEGGAVDAKFVRGIKNLEQAIGTRIRTEQGTDIMYRRLGMKRVIGINLAAVDFDFAKFRVAEAVGADPRLASARVRSIRVADTQERQLIQSADMLDVEIDAEVRGLTQKLRVRAEV